MNSLHVGRRHTLCFQTKNRLQKIHSKFESQTIVRLNKQICSFEFLNS